MAVYNNKIQEKIYDLLSKGENFHLIRMCVSECGLYYAKNLPTSNDFANAGMKIDDLSFFLSYLANERVCRNFFKKKYEYINSVSTRNGFLDYIIGKEKISIVDNFRFKKLWKKYIVDAKKIQNEREIQERENRYEYFKKKLKDKKVFMGEIDLTNK